MLETTVCVRVYPGLIDYCRASHIRNRERLEDLFESSVFGIRAIVSILTAAFQAASPPSVISWRGDNWWTDDHREKARFLRWFLVLCLFFLIFISSSYLFLFCCLHGGWPHEGGLKLVSLPGCPQHRDSFSEPGLPDIGNSASDGSRAHVSQRKQLHAYYIYLCIWDVHMAYSAKSVKCNKNHADISFWLRNIGFEQCKKGLWTLDGRLRLLILNDGMSEAHNFRVTRA